MQMLARPVWLRVGGGDIAPTSRSPLIQYLRRPRPIKLDVSLGEVVGVVGIHEEDFERLVVSEGCSESTARGRLEVFVVKRAASPRLSISRAELFDVEVRVDVVQADL